MRYVAAGSTDCSTSLGDSTFLAHDEPGCGSYGGYTSVMLVGYQNVPADAGTIPPYDAGVDDAGPDAAPLPVSTSLATLAALVVSIEDEACGSSGGDSYRIVHVAADSPGPVGMTFSGGGTWSLADVPYGGFSTGPTPVDPWGYAAMSTADLAVQFGAFGANYTADGDPTSFFVVHGANGGNGDPRVRRLG